MQNPPSTLGQLISELSKLENSPIDPEKVTQLLSEATVTTSEIQPLLHFRKDRYTRNLVYRSDTFDVIVLCWPPNTGTAVHDHGQQFGWVRVLKGALEEIRYNSPTELDGNKNWIPKVHSRVVVQAGPAVAAVDSVHGIHKLGALDKPTVSLHIYSKPLDTCQVFDEQDGHVDCKELEYDTTPDSRTKQLS